MSKPAIQTRNTATQKYDRSFIARRFAVPLQPTGEQPLWLKGRIASDDYPAEPNWLIAGDHLTALDGLDQAWWQMLPKAAANLVATWRTRVRIRRELARIDARSLREAGIDPAMADFEVAQPFWRKPIKLRDLPADR